MRKKQILFIFSLFFTAPVMAATAQSSCLNTHFQQYHGPSDSVKTISIERLENWSNWCKQGYNAQKIQQAIRPCYNETVARLRHTSNSVKTISFKQSRAIKAQCTQELWLTLTENLNAEDSV